MFESSGLVESTPSSIKWTATMNPPSLAERAAVRTFRMFQKRLHPWWLVTAPSIAYGVLDIVRAWPDLERVLPVTVLVLFIALTAWSHQGFCELLERYDAELRQRRNREFR